MKSPADIAADVVATIGAPANGANGTESPVSGDIDLPRVLDDVEAFLDRFVAFPSEAARVAVTLWAAHTHAVEAFDSTPRLALLSPEPGSGKSRTLEVLDLIVPEPMHVLSASSPAIFRSIGTNPRPTLLFDEVDAIFGRSGRGEDNEDLRGLLNAGHRRGATIPRCVGPTQDVRRFDVYAAAALAGLGDLPDTLMTRSIVVRMRRRLSTETVEPFRVRLHEPPGHELRKRLRAAVAAHADALSTSYPVMPAGIEDRPADVWEPLLAVADVADGGWGGRARAACQALAGESVSRAASLGVRLLADLREVFGNDDRLSTATILDRLHGMEEAPWSDLRGRPLDARGLARMLGDYGIASATVRIGDKTPKGYRREDLHDTWQRYTPPGPQHPQQPQHARNDEPEMLRTADHVAPHQQYPQHDEPLHGNDVAPVADVAALRGWGAANAGVVASSGGDDADLCVECGERPSGSFSEYCIRCSAEMPPAAAP